MAAARKIISSKQDITKGEDTLHFWRYDDHSVGSALYNSRKEFFYEHCYHQDMEHFKKYQLDLKKSAEAGRRPHLSKKIKKHKIPVGLKQYSEDMRACFSNRQHRLDLLNC